MKKIALITTALLAACSSELDQKYPNAKYKISNSQMKEYVLQMNNAEQCIHPNLAGLSYEQAQAQVYSKYSELEQFVWNYGVVPKVLEKIIGEQNAKTILADDEASQHYFFDKLEKFNHQNANVNARECEKFKMAFSDMMGDTLQLIHSPR
ncbi:DUF5358 family protein [Bibersteinia trehalosi]|uniref:DUF5358 family protein n=1 Tax=Bibersteinia trehalosi TaxID=47735 RepID=UPI002D77F8A0|nr:DUF5358 family protein [Bibersteinia trehalosi]